MVVRRFGEAIVGRTAFTVPTSLFHKPASVHRNDLDSRYNYPANNAWFLLKPAHCSLSAQNFFGSIMRGYSK